jgi:hypothetical protein
MGLDSGGGALKFSFKDSIEDCANNNDDDRLKHTAVRIAACGNFEDKRVMSVDCS